jgi:membrane protein DedA with SNARE-associated domain
MKKIILYAMMFAIPALSFAQSTENKVPAIKTDYLKKSKNQKTAAWILLGGGFALTTTSILIATPKATEDISYGFGGFLAGQPAPENNYTAESILLVTGTAAMLGSIPLFIASGKNKRKATTMTTSIKMEQATMIQNLSFVQRSYPAIALKINL